MALSKIVENSIADSAISSSKLKDFAAAVDLNGVELVLDADADTSITADTDDRIDFKIANTDHISIGTSSGDTVIKAMVDAKDIKFQQFDGRTLLDINDGGFVGIENGATGPGVIRIFEDTDNGSNYVGLSVGNVSTAYTLVFPNADGSSGQALTTNGSGVLSFTTLSANTPSSADGQALGSASLEWSDLFLADASTIQFGADQDVILTHVADTGLLLSGTNVIQFNDASQNIGAPSNAILDINATDEIELNATLVDVNANLDVSGTITSGGVITGTAFTAGSAVLAEAELELLDGLTAGTAIASKVVTTDASIDTTGQRNLTISGELDAATLDISGAIDVAGTANLDVVDIDGAVDMASTLQVDGAITSSAGMTITTADNTNQLTLVSTDEDGGSGPKLTLQRDSASPADGDVGGRIHFVADDDGGNTFEAALIDVTLTDVSNGNEDATLDIKGIVAGSEVKKVSFGAETVFNEDSADLDFRVETNGQTHTIFAEGSTDRVGILTSSPQKVLDVTGDAKVSTDLTVGDDLFMLSDGAVIHFGTDSDITMTHVADTGLTIQNSGNAVATLLLKSTDADENIGPSLHLHRDSANAADNDETGQIVWRFDNDAQEDTEGFKIKTLIKDASNGTEDFQFDMQTMVAGSIRSRMKSDGTETVFNEDSVDIDWRVESNGQSHMLFVDAANDRMGIQDSSPAYMLESGNSDSGKGWSLANENNIYKIRARSSATDLQTHIQFENSNGICGTIKTTGTAAQYNTSSDYRLKENVDYDWDATTRLKQLKPARFNWIADDTNTLLDGFIAHEVTSIVPEAVSGEKDATETLTNVVKNADGSLYKCNFTEAEWVKGKEKGDFASDSTWSATYSRPDYQGIDQAKLVPLLVKTIQELEARIKSLEDA